MRHVRYNLRYDFVRIWNKSEQQEQQQEEEQQQLLNS